MPAYKDISLLFLRLFSGGFMAILHGWPKFMKLLNGNTEFGDPIGVGSTFTLIFAVFAELICSLLIVSGLFTRISTIPLIITMIIAAFVVHIDHGLHKQELPLLYFGIYLILLTIGPGKYSLDKYLRNK